MAIEEIISFDERPIFQVRLYNPEKELEKQIIHATDVKRKLVNEENLAESLKKIAQLYQKEVIVYVTKKADGFELRAIAGEGVIVGPAPTQKSKAIRGYLLDGFAYATPKKILSWEGVDISLPRA